MLNAKNESNIFINYKSFVNFVNVNYHEDIFIKWAVKLRMLNVKIIYIKSEKNKIINELSRMIFYNKNYSVNDFVRKLFKEIMN